MESVEKKPPENLDSKISKTKNGRLIMQWKCGVCGIKKSRFVKEQEAKGLLNNLGIKTLLDKIPLVGDILFYVYKMNEIMNKFLLTGDKFMPETNSRQLGFTYSVCGRKEKTRLLKRNDDMFLSIQTTFSGQYVTYINKISYFTKLLKVLPKSKILYYKILLIRMLQSCQNITKVITCENTYKNC